MSLRFSPGRWLVIAAVLALAACARVPVRPGDQAAWEAAQVAHEATLAADTDWSLQGRLAVRANGEGGSGRIDWDQRGEAFDIRLSAPVTRASWRLSGGAQGARLDGLEGGPLAGPDARELLRQAVGWDIPFEAMGHWVRGGRAPGPAQLRFGPDGRLEELRQGGWTVEYRDWQPGERLRPRRVFATRDDASVRLVIDQWQWP